MKDNIGYQVRKGDPRVLGVTKIGNGYNFAVQTDGEEPLSLVLCRQGQEQPWEILMDRNWQVGDVCAAYIPSFKPAKYTYYYKCGDKRFLDPYAAVVYGKSAFGRPVEEETLAGGFLPERSYQWENDKPVNLPFSDMILYKVHVRGYTMQRNSKVRHRGTFTGIREKIPYLKELGINALELMPAYDFMEFPVQEEADMSQISPISGEPHLNYWGYTGGNYFAPKPAYCAYQDMVTEVRDMVKSLHQAGISCFMEFYFPADVNPVMVVQVLRHWYIEYHIDGFHLLGEGTPAGLLKEDPLLKKVKLIFQNVPSLESYGKGTGYQKRLAEANEGFKQDMRKFLKSDEDSLENAMMRIRRNPEDFAVINYIVNQDGFTMADLVSYDAKHNEDNGEENQDGTSYNYSWNCGVEGPTRKAAVKKMRKKQMQNAFLFMLLSQGVPMIYGGDEFCNSQNGNNNAYCQDNETGWVDWSGYNRNQDMVQFVREAIAFRQSHSVFHQQRELRVMDYLALGYPDVSYHSNRAWYVQYNNVCRHVGMMYCGDYAMDSEGNKDCFLYVAYNFHWMSHEFALPNLPDKQEWYLIANTDEVPDENCFMKKHEKIEEKVVDVPPRSIAIFMGK